jgi:ABC-type antimicrobial peptide transport system permease subunit
MSKRFDLEEALRTWRAFVSSDTSLSPDDVDELVSHVEDEVDRYTAEGMGLEEAYRAAVASVGTLHELSAGYRSVKWAKLKDEKGMTGGIRVLTALWGSNIRTSFRHLLRSPGYAAVNVLGLSLGLAACLLVSLLVLEERSFDRFHANAERLYRVYTVQERPDRTDRHPGMSLPVGPAVQEGAAGVEHAVRILNSRASLTTGSESFSQDLLYTDPGFFHAFSFELVQGQADQVLADPNTIILTEENASKLFGTADPLGQTVRVTSGAVETDLVVSGVVRSAPSNSTIEFEGITRVENHPTWVEDGQNPDSFNHELYVLLESGISADQAATEISRTGRVVMANFSSYLNSQMGYDQAEGTALQLALQPMVDMHLDDSLPSDRSGNPVALLILSLVALAVLGSGIINFVNLSIGRAAGRTREIGIRQAIGAARADIGQQFWTETGLLCLVALVVGVGLTAAILPGFNGFLRRDLSLELFDSGRSWLVMASLLLGTSFVAGLWPSWLMTRLEPVKALKGGSLAGKTPLVGRMLVVIQFCVVVLFAVALVTMTRQLDLLHAADPGFDEEQVVAVPLSSSIPVSDSQAYMARVQSVPGVVSVASSSMGLGESRLGSRSTSIRTFNTHGVEIAAHMMDIDPDLVPTLGLEVLDGRSFSGLDSDRSGILINERLYEHIREHIRVGDRLEDFTPDGADAPVILGVVKDFHFLPLREDIKPLIITNGTSTARMRIYIRIQPEGVPATLAAIEAAWRDVLPDVPYMGSFLDEDVDRQYIQETRQIQLAGGAMGVAVIIACFGLLGLAVQSTTRRRKEIGVRRVLGASVGGLVVHLSKEYLLLVGVAIVLVSPLAWMAMQAWLEQFAYRVTLGPGIFLLAGAGVATLAWLAVAWNTVRAARANPVSSLRSE